MAYIVRLRRFRPSDLDEVLAIERSSFGADAYPAELFAGYHRRCPELFLVALVTDRVAGYCIALMRGKRAELVSIAVAPAFRRRGVGEALVQGLMRRLRRRRAERMALMVRAGNHSARRFYDAFGFRRVRVVRGYYEDGADGLLLTRLL